MFRNEIKDICKKDIENSIIAGFITFKRG